MTTYTITIQDVKRSEVLSLLEAVPGHCSFKLNSDAGDELKSKGNSKKKVYAAPGDKLTLTGKSATKGSNREKILVTFEKLEVKQGIGSVTRKMFRDECAKKGQDSQIIYQLIREGYLKTL